MTTTTAITPRRARLALGLFLSTLSAALALALAASPANAQEPARLPFTATLSNTAPLAFGMDRESVAAALGAPLTYVRGSPGNETFVVIRMVNGDGFLFRKDPLYLQFRHGRLTGWKGNWSRDWLWRNKAIF